MESLHQHFRGKPFALIAIDIQEKKEKVERLVKDQGLSFTNLLDETGKVASLYGVSSTPVKFLIDSQGKMVGAALGFREWDKEEIKALIQHLFEAKDS